MGSASIMATAQVAFTGPISLAALLSRASAFADEERQIAIHMLAGPL